jgi:hypothetical protein
MRAMTADDCFLWTFFVTRVATSGLFCAEPVAAPLDACVNQGDR